MWTAKRALIRAGNEVTLAQLFAEPDTAKDVLPIRRRTFLRWRWSIGALPTPIHKRMYWRLQHRMSALMRICFVQMVLIQRIMAQISGDGCVGSATGRWP